MTQEPFIYLFLVLFIFGKSLSAHFLSIMVSTSYEFYLEVIKVDGITPSLSSEDKRALFGV